MDDNGTAIERDGLPKTFKELSKGLKTFSLQELQGIQPQAQRPKPNPVEETDYCRHGQDSHGNWIYCEIDPHTKACGYVHCVPYDPRKT